MTGKEFSSWMESQKLTIEEASTLFGPSPQTLYNWRSAGIPPGKVKWVKKMMSNHEASKSQQLPDRISIEPTPEQFDRWNQCALNAKQLTRDWIMDAVEDAALEAEQKGIYNSRHSKLPAGLVREKNPESKN